MLPAQEAGVQPILIGNAKVATCVNYLGQSSMQAGAAQVPISIKFEASSERAFGLQPKMIDDPVVATCIDLLAQNILRARAATIPFTIKVTPSR